MKNRILIFACIMAATASAASRTATEAFVTNRITIATNALHQSIAPSIDYTTNNVELTNTIAQVAPAPGNYDSVSNAAMNARSVTDFSVDTNGWVMVWPEGTNSWMSPYQPDMWISGEAILQYDYEWWLNVPGFMDPIMSDSPSDAKELTFTVTGARPKTYRLYRGDRLAFSSEIVKPDYSTSNQTLVNTITQTAPAPGNYSAVSNAAMRAAAQTNDFLRLSGGKMVGDIDMGGQHGAAGVEPIDSAFLRFMEFVFGYGELGLGFGIYRTNGDSLWAEYLFNGDNGYETEFDVMRRMELDAVAAAATNYTDWAIQNIDPAITEFDVYAADVTNVAETVTSNAISTNNAAFVEAVRSTPLTGADPSDLAEIGEYGSYGTVGAAILALIAGLAALKRGKADKTELPYDIVAVTPANGVVTVGPRTISTYTAGDSAAAFTVGVGTGETGKARDCELVIDCTATGAVAPTVTWPATFYPRTDASTDFACEAGKRNVYFISEYAPGEYAVGGWQETAGGNA